MVDRSSQTVLTTGANSGIGLATVLEVARRGFHSVGSVRSDAKAEVVQAAAAEAGIEVETVLLDVTDPQACHRVIDGLPPLHGLVNNAGYALTGAIEDVGDEEAQRLFETMVHAPMCLARLALPGMRETGGGRIVHISSIRGLTTAPFAGHYTGAKHALEALSDALRMEVAGDGVKVVLIEPGGFKTGIWDDFERDIDRREADGTRHGESYRRSLQAQRRGQLDRHRPQERPEQLVALCPPLGPDGWYRLAVVRQVVGDEPEPIGDGGHRAALTALHAV